MVSAIVRGQETPSLEVAKRYALQGATENVGPSLDSVLRNLLLDHDTSGWASAVSTIGKAYSSKHPEKAIVHLEQHLFSAKELFGNQHLVVAELNARIGDVYRKAQVGNFIKAATHFDRAIALYELHRVSNRFLGFVYHFAGNCHTRIGSYEKAARYLHQSSEIRTRERDSLYVAQVCNDLGILYNDLGRFANAHLQYRKGLKFIDLPQKSRKQALLQATLMLNQADNYVNRGIDTDVVSFLSPALKVFSDYQDISGMSAANRSIGQWLMQKGRFKDAFGYLKVGLVLAKDNYGKHHREVAKAHIALSQVYTRLEQYDSVQVHIQKALKSLIPDFLPASIADIPPNKLLYAEPWLLISLEEKAEALVHQYRRTGNLEPMTQALACFDACMNTMELLRDQYSYSADKERLFSSFHNVIKGGIFTSLELAKKTENVSYNERAFGFLKQSKAYSLMEWFSGYEAQRMLSIPDSILERERFLTSRLSGLSESGSDAAELALVKLEFEQLYQELKQAYPAYYEIKYGGSGFSIEETRKRLLEGNEVLLEYALGKEHLACFLISKEHFKVWSFKIDASFHESVSTFTSLIRDPNFNQSVEEQAAEIGKHGHQLYQQLMSPVLSFLDSLGMGKHDLIIVPDGKLHYIPFESLVTEVPKTGVGFNEVHFVIRDRSIRYAYSAATLFHQKATQIPLDGRIDVLGFAPSDSPTELQEIEQILSGEFYSGEWATKQKFIERAGNSRILHIAAHGHLSDDNPLRSGLSFFKGSDDSIPEAFELLAYELFNLDISADLVVLGACNTGRGRLVDGEGVMSLERGFSYAHCKSSVMTLWAVNDQSTATVLKDFYRNLKSASSKHEALRRAQNDFLINSGGIKGHPYFWAGLVFHGDTSSLSFGAQPSTWLLLLLAFPFCAVSLWFLYNKRR